VRNGAAASGHASFSEKSVFFAADMGQDEAASQFKRVAMDVGRADDWPCLTSRRSMTIHGVILRLSMTGRASSWESSPLIALRGHSQSCANFSRLLCESAFASAERREDHDAIVVLLISRCRRTVRSARWTGA